MQTYVVDLDTSVDECAKRNVHDRTKDEIFKLNKYWERTPPHFIRLDITGLMQNDTIQEVKVFITVCSDVMFFVGLYLILIQINRWIWKLLAILKTIWMVL